MKLNQINIRDPFVLYDSSTYYMYGTRAKSFGCGTDGFDVYSSTDLVNWSKPSPCFDSEKYGLNRQVNWAPEVHRYNGGYYMLATFTRENGLRGTYVLKADSPLGPFAPHSFGAVTPQEWECLDGTLYVDKKGTPYLVFCHEHTQITDGTVCYVQLNNELTESIGEPKYIFSGSSPYFIKPKPQGEHYITDGPFMYRTAGGELLMLWSTFINHKYAQCIAKSSNGEIDGEFQHLPPLIDNDGGHGMIFEAEGKLMLTYHSPNKTLLERPKFVELTDNGNSIAVLKP